MTVSRPTGQVGLKKLFVSTCSAADADLSFPPPSQKL
jgi:hypothetical protein